MEPEPNVKETLKKRKVIYNSATNTKCNSNVQNQQTCKDEMNVSPCESSESKTKNVCIIHDLPKCFDFTLEDNLTNTSGVISGVISTLTNGNLPNGTLPNGKVSNVNFKTAKNNTCFQNIKLKIKTIKIKRNAPKVIKDVLNYEHNLKLIQSKLEKSTSHSNIFKTTQNNLLIFKISNNTNYKEILNSWLKLIMLHHLKYHVYARLKNGEYGVSIVAIRDIPKGTRVFENTAGPCTMYYPITINNSAYEQSNTKDERGKLVGDPTRDLLNDFYLSLLTDGKAEYPIPVLGPNMIDMSFFLNHSYDNNNIMIENSNQTRHCDMSSYVAKNNIKEGDTLNINYAEFALDDQNINKIKLENLVGRMKFLKDLYPFKNQFNNNYTFIGDMNLLNIKKYWIKE